MTKDNAYAEYAGQFLEQLPKGAFLTVKSGEVVNTMTIGWGSTGFIWQLPVMMVMVRYSRYTYELIEKSSDFSISVPLKGELKKALGIAGTRSGRDIDKFRECQLTQVKARVIDSPVIGECSLFYECRILFKQPMDAGNLDNNIRDLYYADNNLHVMYFGEIMACYNK